MSIPVSSNLMMQRDSWINPYSSRGLENLLPNFLADHPRKQGNLPPAPFGGATGASSSNYTYNHPIPSNFPVNLHQYTGVSSMNPMNPIQFTSNSHTPMQGAQQFASQTFNHDWNYFNQQQYNLVPSIPQFNANPLEQSWFTNQYSSTAQNPSFTPPPNPQVQRQTYLEFGPYFTPASNATIHVYNNNSNNNKNGELGGSGANELLLVPPTTSSLNPSPEQSPEDLFFSG
ncbi:hypothetical protein O6P43_020077 [Quillaja saponaria]|uniref:Uncharacterized protein n=1 Tax=Quillaja saponaria TaxID=32244 RepID=A0AAD7LJW0_QUISA|nr:hypothetical protein O6P43_020077 [Quillaja saponaria]